MLKKPFSPRRLCGLALLALGLLEFVSCSEGDVPFPYRPNEPTAFDRAERYEVFGMADSLQGRVAVCSYRRFSDRYGGLVNTYVVCFNEAGHCLDMYYRDTARCLHYTFAYDANGRRVEELCTVDSAGTAFAEADSLVYRTTYTYSANGRRVKARIAGPDGRRHTFRLRYDDAGRLTRFIYPDGSRISYRYDDAGELVSVILPDALEFTPQAAEEAPAVEHYRRDDPYNWTRRTRIEPSGDATLTERSFEYYGM